MGADRRTPGYLVKKKLQKEKLKEKVRMWAWGFKKRLEEGRKSGIAKMCWEEMVKMNKERKADSK